MVKCPLPGFIGDSNRTDLDSVQQDAQRQNGDFFAQAAASLRVHHEQVSACVSTLVQTLVATRRATKDNILPYSGCCVEFCTFEDSSLGVVLGEHKLDVLRLTTDFYDCSDDKLQSELRGQVKQTPGVDLWGSIPCAAWSTWQHMSFHVQGAEYVETLRKARLLSRKFLWNFN